MWSEDTVYGFINNLISSIEYNKLQEKIRKFRYYNSLIFDIYENFEYITKCKIISILVFKIEQYLDFCIEILEEIIENNIKCFDVDSITTGYHQTIDTIKRYKEFYKKYNKLLSFTNHLYTLDETLSKFEEKFESFKQYIKNAKNN